MFAPLDSPLLSAARGGRVEGRSPGLATLKEAFDITYAVHRMEEEGARRRKYNGRGGAGARGFLSGLNEDDEDEEDEEVPQTSRTIQPASAATAQAKKAPAPASSRGRKVGGSSKTFELDLDGATLLGRRHQRGVGKSPLAALPITSGDDLDPGSPMRM